MLILILNFLEIVVFWYNFEVSMQEHFGFSALFYCYKLFILKIII